MAQQDDTPRKDSARDAKDSSSNTGATVGTGYEDKQGDYPAYTGRIAEATEDSPEVAKEKIKTSDKQNKS